MFQSWEDYRMLDLQRAEKGTARVDEKNASELDALMVQMSAFSAARHGIRSGWGLRFRPGPVTRLHINGQLMMSDTYDEVWSAYDVIDHATGTVLINGLGLGCVLKGVLMNRGVTHVRVIENNEDVIGLVAPYFEDRWPGRFEIVLADALTYKPAKGEIFNYVWHDIWPDINGDNWEQYKLLHRRYGGRISGWQGSWMLDTVRKMAAQYRASAREGDCQDALRELRMNNPKVMYDIIRD